MVGVPTPEMMYCSEEEEEEEEVLDIEAFKL
jgi:hypothetical protein